MGTVNIETRVTKKEVKYRARVRIRSEKLAKGYYEESKTFLNKTTAKNWAKDRVKILEKEGLPSRDPKEDELTECTLSTLIQMLLESEDSQHFGRSKRYALKAIAKTDLAMFTVSGLSERDIINFAKERKIDGVSPYTAYQDILYIKGVLEIAKREFGVRADTDCIAEALKYFREQLKKKPKGQRLIEFKAEERYVIPTKNEMKLMRDALLERQEHPSAKIPFLTILDFAIDTCMRVSEICRVEWRDFNEEDRTLTIRDRKHPKNKLGNHQTIPLIGCAYDILLNRKAKITSQNEKLSVKFNYNTEIFPYNPRSVSAGWQRSRAELIAAGERIDNIRFHDLRAFGASKLIEEGWDLSQVSVVTGHRDLNILNNIYLRLKPKDIAMQALQKQSHKN
ncbi:site-specific integrase [uncultured Shewanella sp.]|uniref:tyrosine-type recombinase/integrase n=1 Tax=uncultured Shewanella sp. TaxID=173975 RepID=UPI002629B6A0|nr:site-specific integrase [uncultured Shewanella sp.]